MRHFKPTCPPPADMVCPRILAISKFLKRDFNRTLAEQGLFPGQDHVLMTVKMNEGLTPSELADALGVSLATISVSIKRMEKSGFLLRRQDEADARRSRLYLTDKASRISLTIRSRMDRQEDILTRGMSPGDKEAFMRLMDIAITNIQQEGDFIHEQ